MCEDLHLRFETSMMMSMEPGAHVDYSSQSLELQWLRGVEGVTETFATLDGFDDELDGIDGSLSSGWAYCSE